MFVSRLSSRSHFGGDDAFRGDGERSRRGDGERRFVGDGERRLGEREELQRNANALREKKINLKQSTQNKTKHDRTRRCAQRTDAANESASDAANDRDHRRHRHDHCVDKRECAVSTRHSLARARAPRFANLRGSGQSRAVIAHVRACTCHRRLMSDGQSNFTTKKEEHATNNSFLPM